MSLQKIAQTAQQHKSPSIARRFICSIYETILLIGVIATTVIFPHTFYAQATQQTAAPWLILLHLIATLAVYFIWFWQRSGQTLAMKTWGIRVIDARTGQTITLKRGLLRFMLCWPSLLCFGLGLIWALLDNEQQFLHDRLAGTHLILDKTQRHKQA